MRTYICLLALAFAVGCWIDCSDLEVDAGADRAAIDGGDCECDYLSQCCDGCRLLGPDVVCAAQAQVKWTCLHECSPLYREEVWKIYCDGVNPGCTGIPIKVVDRIAECAEGCACTMHMPFCWRNPECNQGSEISEVKL